MFLDLDFSIFLLFSCYIYMIDKNTKLFQEEFLVRMSN